MLLEYSAMPVIMHQNYASQLKCLLPQEPKLWKESRVAETASNCDPSYTPTKEEEMIHVPQGRRSLSYCGFTEVHQVLQIKQWGYRRSKDSYNLQKMCSF